MWKKSYQCLPYGSTGISFPSISLSRFLYFLDKTGNMLFAAIQIDSVYYLPSKRCTRIQMIGSKQFTQDEKIRILKEWHLQLGHTNRERLMRVIATQRIVGVPHIPYKELKELQFSAKQVQSQNQGECRIEIKRGQGQPSHYTPFTWTRWVK